MMSAWGYERIACPTEGCLPVRRRAQADQKVARLGQLPFFAHLAASCFLTGVHTLTIALWGDRADSGPFALD